MGPFRLVDVLSAVNVTIQKSERAVKLVVHVDELKSYLGDAPAAWVVIDLLDVTGEARAESPAPSHFTRGDAPAGPDGTDVECEHVVKNIPYSVGNPSTSLPGVKEAVSGVRTRTPRLETAHQLGCVARLFTYATIIAKQ